MTLIFCSLPTIVKATDIDTNISGYTEILNIMKVYVKGAGAIVLMIGCGDFFISLSNESTERLVRAMQVMGAGFFLILADSFVQAIGHANGKETFNMLFNMIALIVSFIGAVLTMLGSYRTMNSIKEKNAEVKSKAIKVVFSGLMLIAISRSLATFL